MNAKVIKSPRFWVLRVAEICIATVLVFLVTSWLTERERQRFEAIPPTNWFEVTEVFVPDHPQGSDPQIIYDRTIKREFQGFWVVEVQRRDDVEEPRFFPACTGSGVANYEPTDYIRDNLVTWQWFLNRECAVPPGTYRMVVTYDMRLPGEMRVKRYRTVSNTFRVLR